MSHLFASIHAIAGACHDRLRRCRQVVAVFALAIAWLGMPSANAAIVYSGLKNVSVPKATGLFIDVQTGTYSTSGQLPGYDLSFVYFQYTTAPGDLTFIASNRTAAGILGDFVTMGTATFFYPEKLGPGALVGDSRSFNVRGVLGGDTGPFGKEGHGYVGFRFLSANNQTLYGWVHLVIGADLQTTVVDWAYENDGRSILAGATEETTLAVPAKVDEVIVGGAARIKLTRQGDLSVPLMVHYKAAATSTAVSGTDYRPLSGTVTIPAGAASAKLVVQTIAYSNLDVTRKLVLTFAGDFGYKVAAPAQAKILIAPPPLPPG